MTPTELRAAVRTLPDRTILGLTVWGEARGEPVKGRIAVAWVIKNRAANRRQTIAQVCLQRWQFSCWWGSDANAEAVRNRAFRVLTGEVVADANWLETLQVAHQVLVGAVADPTEGADHYVTAALYEDAHRPAWVGIMRVTQRLGRHVFMSDDTARRA